MKKLICPGCQGTYPRWRIVFSPGVFHCLSCGARLTLSRDSARKIGAIGGFALFGTAALSGLVLGLEQLWTWQFLVLFLVFSFVLGQIIKAIVAVLVLRDDFR